MSTFQLASGYTVTTDRSLMDLAAIHEWLSTRSYWSKGIAFETVKTAFDHSFVIGVLLDGRQVGYARLITDYATFGYLADVFITEAHRGKGLSKAMLLHVTELDWVKKLRRLALTTVDAHGLYAQLGFTAPLKPERWMEKSQQPIVNNH